jgi:hypothetical protein
MLESNGRIAAAVFGGIFLVALFAWWMSLAPAPLPADAPDTEFSAARALKHIEAISVEPHPAGSHANEKVYDYIVSQLEAMGTEHVVERQFIKRHGSTVEWIGAILARVPGTNSTGALAIDAHHDSTPYGPGAADDNSGVAAMLETIRALQAGSPMMNDTLFCFSDKEEMGGPGGPEVFIRHPWFKDVTAVLGLEARGTSGPALMFETGPENGFLIRQMAQSESHPRATSIMFDFYDRMPFGSNFSHYKHHPKLPGLNVAYIDDFADYHTKLDRPDRVSLASIQHHGAYTLGMARQLGNVDMSNPRAPNAAYFNVLGSWMVVYPYSWSIVFTGIALALFAVVLVVGLVKRRVGIMGMLAGMGVVILSSLLALAVTGPLAYMIFQLFREHALYRNDSFSIAILLTNLSMFVFCARMVRRVRPASLLAGVLILWSAALVAVQLYFPGGAYGLTWPLLFMSLGLLALILSGSKEAPSTRGALIATASVLPAVIILIPLLDVVSYALTALAMPLFSLPVLLVVAALLPATQFIPRRYHARGGAVMLATGIVVLLYALLTNTPSAERPRQNCLAYAVEFDEGKAYWVTGDKELDAWTSQYFDADAPRVGANHYTAGNDEDVYLMAEAPMPSFKPVQVTITKELEEDGRRKLWLHVDSPRDAQEIFLKLVNDVPIYNATACGIKVRDRKSGEWRLHLDTIPFDGGEVYLETDAGTTLEFQGREVSYKLEDIEGFIPRPAELMTETNRRLDRSNDLRSSHTYSVVTFSI